MGQAALSQEIRRLAIETGFDAFGISAAEPAAGGEILKHWLDDGCAGSMSYMHQYFQQRVDPRELLPGARSVIVVCLNYHQERPEVPSDYAVPATISRYAWGRDYHKVLKNRLFKLADRIREIAGQEHAFKACVDTAPILEREFAQAAGIGWIGKNTSLIREGLGSYIFLGELVTTLELVASQPAEDRCGTCRRCIDACPTGALVGPRRLDARKCISYLTIEHDGEIPEELASKMGNCIYGCDICHEVCPHNQKVPVSNEPDFAIRPPAPYVDAAEWVSISDEDYTELLKGTAIKRAKPKMLRRNAGIVIENMKGKTESCRTSKR